MAMYYLQCQYFGNREGAFIIFKCLSQPPMRTVCYAESTLNQHWLNIMFFDQPDIFKYYEVQQLLAHILPEI